MKLDRILAILLLCAVCFVLILVFKPNFSKLYELRSSHFLMTQKLRLEKARNEYLRKELTSLQNDPQWIEKVAREKLGWTRADETVYRFPEE